MYDKRSEYHWLEAIVTGSIGAGIVTSFAVSQGQPPLIGLGITLFAGVSAWLIDCALH